MNNQEEKQRLSIVVEGCLDRELYRLQQDDRPTWAKGEQVRKAIAHIVSIVVNDKNWPDIVERCRNRSDGHVVVVVEDELDESDLPIVDPPKFVSHVEFGSGTKRTGTREKEPERGELILPIMQPLPVEQVGCRGFDLGPALMIALQQQKKIDVDERS
jgi:hypothetical protein